RYRHVVERGSGWDVGRDAKRDNGHLAELSPRNVSAWPEVEARARLANATASVSTDNACMVDRLDVLIEGIGGRHVVEGGGRRRIEGYECAPKDDLGGLTPRDV